MEVNELFRANKRESAVDLVVNNIKQLLIEKKLKPGDRLPSELEISEGMNVSRGSVREAMKILSAFGLVDIKIGNGTYVCETPGNSLMDSLLFSFFVSNPDLENLYEFRHVFEQPERNDENRGDFPGPERKRSGISPSVGELYKKSPDGTGVWFRYRLYGAFYHRQSQKSERRDCLSGT